VRLPILDGDPATDYINANYVRGYGDRRAKEYIAAQGPLPSCLEPWVRMVVSCNIKVMVMITGLVEAGKHKCARYWPEADGEEMIIGSVVRWRATL
jgi:protein tyrosine phosphatase